MRLVIIESPYADAVDEHVAYARKAMLDSLARGEAPLASHLLYTQILDDKDDTQRRLGMAAGFAWTAKAEVVAVYDDYGVSSGMARGIAEAMLLGIAVEYRTIGKLQCQ